MHTRMKVVVAYDGSSYAIAAVEDLQRAALPSDSDVVVVSVVDLFEPSPPPSDFDLNSLVSRRVDAFLTTTREHENQVIDETTASAAEVVERLRERFPGWMVNYEVLRGNPEVELLRKAEEWQADLIVAGTRGRSAIGRFFLGSVSRTLAGNAACSVRVVSRAEAEPDGGPPRIIIGVRIPGNAERLVAAVKRRDWPADTSARIVGVDGPAASDAAAQGDLERAAGMLRDAGLEVSVQVKSGDPTAAFLDEADAWDADAIFIYGAAASAGWGLDEAAAGLVSGAQCPIEIVR